MTMKPSNEPPPPERVSFWEFLKALRGIRISTEEPEKSRKNPFLNSASGSKILVEGVREGIKIRPHFLTPFLIILLLLATISTHLYLLQEAKLGVRVVLIAIVIGLGILIRFIFMQSRRSVVLIPYSRTLEYYQGSVLVRTESVTEQHPLSWKAIQIIRTPRQQRYYRRLYALTFDSESICVENNGERFQDLLRKLKEAGFDVIQSATEVRRDWSARG